MTDSIARLSQLCAGNHREKVYPFDAIGALIVGTNGAWGDCKAVVPIDAIFPNYSWEATGTERGYNLIGVNLTPTANAAKQMTVQLFRIDKSSAVVLAADSGDAQANKDRVEIADTSGFLVDDIVWLYDDDTTDGEIGKVEAIVEDDYLDLTANMANDYTVAQNAKVYLIRRGTVDANRAITTPFSVASLKDMRTAWFHGARSMAAGDGVLARAYGLEAGNPTAAVAVIYDDSEEVVI